MNQTDPTLVIDFGTTTSTAALIIGENVRLLKEPTTGSWSWPSAVCLAGEHFLVGTTAERSRQAYPGAYRSEFKRDLGENTRIPLGDKSFTPQDLVVELLQVFLARAQRVVGSPPRHLLLTVPASYAVHDPRRDLMIEAGERAGFAEVELLAEPVAAALAPLEGPPLQPGSVVLVYDFGGGTFDAAAVRLSSEDNTVLGCGSREHCGGLDVDKALEDIILDLGGSKLRNVIDRATQPGESPEQVAARRARLELTDLVRNTKHQLSDVPIAADYFLPANLPIEVQAIELTSRIAPLIQETIDCCHEVLALGRLTTDDISAILLVGGATRMPVVADTLRRELSMTIRYAEDPGTAVAQGAAQWNISRSDHLLQPTPFDDRAIPLRWSIPGRSGTVVRWLIEPGKTITPDQPLMILRKVDGMLARLTSGTTEGELVDRYGDSGDTIVSGQWIATIKPPVRVPDVKVQAPTSETGTTRTDTPQTQTTRTAPRPAPATGADRPPKSAPGKPPSNSTLLEHGSTVNALTFGERGELLIAAATNGVVRIWDTSSRKEWKRLTTNSAVAALGCWNGRIILAHSDSRLEMLALDTGHRIWTAECNATSLSIDPNGRRIALVTSEGAIEIRDADSGRLLVGSLQGSSAAFDKKGDRLACGTSGGVLALRNGKDFAEYRKILTSGRPVLSIVFDPDDTWVAAGLRGGNITVRSLPDGLDRLQLTTGDDILALTAAIRKGSTLLAARTEKSVFVWSLDAPTHSLLAFQTGVGTRIGSAASAFAVSPAGGLLATDGQHGTVRLTPIPEQ